MRAEIIRIGLRITNGKKEKNRILCMGVQLRQNRSRFYFLASYAAQRFLGNSKIGRNIFQRHPVANVGMGFNKS